MQQIRKIHYGFLWLIANAVAPALPAYAWIISQGSSGALLHLQVAVAIILSAAVAPFIDAMFYEMQRTNEEVSLANRILAFLGGAGSTFAMTFVGFGYFFPMWGFSSIAFLSAAHFAVSYILHFFTRRLELEYGYRSYCA